MEGLHAALETACFATNQLELAERLLRQTYDSSLVSGSDDNFGGWRLWLAAICNAQGKTPKPYFKELQYHTLVWLWLWAVDGQPEDALALLQERLPLPGKSHTTQVIQRMQHKPNPHCEWNQTWKT